MDHDLVQRLVATGLEAVATFGPNPQIDKAVEELQELLAELIDETSYDDITPTKRGAIVDEVADVLVVVFQLREMFGREAVDERVRFKLARLQRIMRGDGA